jgi:hypothetical protein
MNRTLLFLTLTYLAACDIKSLMKAEEKAADAGIVASPAVVSDVTFVKAVPKRGTKVQRTTKTAYKFTFLGKVFREEDEDDAVIEVQSSDEFRVSKAAIDVKKLTTAKQEGSANETRSTNPLSGSRYVLSRTDDGKVSALDSGGSPVAASLVAQLKDHYGDIVERDKSRDFLPNRPVKIGEKLTPSSDAVLKLIGVKDDGSATVDGVEFILQSVSGDSASFNVALTLTVKGDPQTRMRSKLEGTIAIRPKDSIMTSASLRGPLTILDAKGNDKGSGDLSFTATQTNL